MFSQPDDESTKNKTSNNPLKKRKFKNKKKRKKKVNSTLQTLKIQFKKKDSRLASAMSSWAQSFTTATTWQMKHQLAFWKARAKALEYENRLLHEIIKNQHYINSNINDEQELQGEGISQVEETEDEETIELDENYLQFFTATTKFREERDKQRREETEEAKEHFKNKKDYVPDHDPERLKDLYGERWQKISALEMSIQSKYMNELNTEHPNYWPNIPFNFDFS